MVSYGGWKDNVYAIAAVIYVGGMFLLFYYYEAYPGNSFTTLPTLTIVSLIGAFLLFGQFFVAALAAPRKSQERKSEASGS